MGRTNKESSSAGVDAPKKKKAKNDSSSKTYTSKSQFKTLVQLLEQNPGLANNTLKGNDVIEGWKEFSDTLNSIGPKRDVSGWKKVVSDYKSNIKRKLADNRKELLETGGGPNNMVLLTDLEERIAILSKLYTAVDGNTGTTTYGVPNPIEARITPTTSSAVTPSTSRNRSYTLGTAYFSDGQSEEEEEGIVATDAATTTSAGVATVADKENQTPRGQSTPSGQSHLPARKRVKTSDSLSLLQRQVDSQETFNEKLGTQMEKLTNSIKDIAHYQRQTYKSMQNLEKTKTEELNEFKRHNRAMEKLALDKLKVKKQILELELSRLTDD